MYAAIRVHWTSHFYKVPEKHSHDPVCAGQSPDQAELLAGLEDKTAVYVEGAFRLWLDNYQVPFVVVHRVV